MLVLVLVLGLESASKLGLAWAGGGVGVGWVWVWGWGWGWGWGLGSVLVFGPPPVYFLLEELVVCYRQRRTTYRPLQPQLRWPRGVGSSAAADQLSVIGS